MIRKILIKLRVIQVIDNEERNRNGVKRKGRGFMEARRLNPYNPLSYIVVVVGAIIGIILFGFVGIFSEIDTKNPFKWN